MRANRTYALFFIQTLQNILEVFLCAAFGMLLIHPLAQIYIVPAILLTLAIATTWHINNVLFEHESIILSLLSSVKTFFTTMYDTANKFFFSSHEARDTPKEEASKKEEIVLLNTTTSSPNVTHTTYSGQQYNPMVTKITPSQFAPTKKHTMTTFNDENTDPNKEASRVLTGQKDTKEPTKKRPARKPDDNKKTAPTSSSLQHSDLLTLHSFDSLYNLIIKYLPIIEYRLPENTVKSKPRELSDLISHIMACQEIMREVAKNIQEKESHILSLIRKSNDLNEESTHIKQYNELQKSIDNFKERVEKDISTSLQDNGEDALLNIALIYSLMPYLTDKPYLESLRDDSTKITEFEVQLTTKLTTKTSKNNKHSLQDPRAHAVEKAAIFSCSRNTGHDGLWFFGDQRLTNALIKSLKTLHQRDQIFKNLLTPPSKNHKLSTQEMVAHVLPIIQESPAIRKLHAMLKVQGKEISVEKIMQVGFIRRKHEFFLHPQRSQNMFAQYALSHPDAKIEEIQQFMATARADLLADISPNPDLSQYYGYSYPASMTLYTAPLIFTEQLSECEKYYWDRLCFYYKIDTDFPDDIRIYQYLGRLIAKEIHKSKKDGSLEQKIADLDAIIHSNSDKKENSWTISQQKSINVYAFFKNYITHVKTTTETKDKMLKIQDTLEVLKSIDPIIALDILLDAYNEDEENSTGGHFITYASESEVKTPISSGRKQQLSTPLKSSRIRLLFTPPTSSKETGETTEHQPTMPNRFEQFDAIYNLLPEKVSQLLEYDMLKNLVFSKEAKKYSFRLNEIIGIFDCLDDMPSQKEALQRFLEVYPNKSTELAGLYQNIQSFIEKNVSLEHLTPHTPS